MNGYSATNKTKKNKTSETSESQFEKEFILHDYYIAYLSRQLSIAGRKEVLSGKAKFGIFGDGKELAQIAMAKNFQKGDWRSGYYRDQTFMLYIGLLTPVEFFAQLYGDTDLKHNSQSGGRNFNNHFSTANYTEEGNWLNLMDRYNSSGDISPTAGQMPRLLGLAYASKLFRENHELHKFDHLSRKGNEVAFGTIGDASTSEGHFFETMNAAGVLQVPLAIAVWDDGYGISVSTEYQTTKQSISEALKGFEADALNKGILIYKAKGWDYLTLCKVFAEGIARCRSEHIPVLFHIDEMTQPSGHSTSGSHERYKSKERLEWEEAFDPIKKFREWIVTNKIATSGELEEIEANAILDTDNGRNQAWKEFTQPLLELRDNLVSIIENKTCSCRSNNSEKIDQVKAKLLEIPNPIYKDIVSSAKKIIRQVCADCPSDKDLRKKITGFINSLDLEGAEKYSKYLYNETSRSALNVEIIPPEFSEQSPVVNGREIIRDNFNELFKQYPLLVAFGEDVGKIGSVNQTYEGLQKKYGELRITDTGIREATIIGQGIGLALRGLRPIAEIQYFDYLLYGLQTLSDDLATTHWRTRGQQVAPLIISTRGHRLEGIWHSGSPMAMVASALRGIYVCVPRNLTQAAGFYNTLLKSDDPAIVIEPLNAYRLKELRPDNIGNYTIPLGVPEVLTEGTDVTLVTYGSCVRIAQEAIEQLKEFNISVELIDVQTLLPFDIHHTILESIKKTNRIVFFDEDVPGGASAFMMQKVIEEQNAYPYLDSPPRTIAAMEHRPAYSTDGDYFSNPNSENVFETIYNLMHETNPKKWPRLYY
jgi:pyruvate/2-oxoglutarate/acetoin dehydrogenase E1 component/TPP-dependent pyruvate/acetoin dehydrogenase alpha subunit